MIASEQLIAENERLAALLAGGAEARLRAIPGVLHVSVGLKEKKGAITGELCFRVYVREKKRPEEIPPEQSIPPAIEGVRTDVNFVPEVHFDQDVSDHAKYRPVQGGIEITNRIIAANADLTAVQISRGTLGCIAKSNENDDPVLLSNWHVLTANGGRKGDRIYQPSPTTVPQVPLENLPLRPSDKDNAIGKILRSKVNNKVDAAVATIDVSSCCGCCGIKFQKSVHGLSASGRPPLNTITGQAKAVSGMPVFKSGKTTLRTEGRVVDASYPTFTIDAQGTTFTFDGQMAIANSDGTAPFSDHGDSGSVVINLENKIVGLLFSSAANGTTSGGVSFPFLSFANHIDDVLSALNISILFSSATGASSGERIALVIPPPYRELYDTMRERPGLDALFAIAERHRDELAALVNHSRPVTVAWRRSQGPAFLAAIMNAVRDGEETFPTTMNGCSLMDGLRRMQAVLIERGSPELRAALTEHGPALLRAIGRGGGFDKLMEELDAAMTIEEGAPV